MEEKDYSKLFKSLEYTGSQINYYFVCKRKLWYFSNNIEMERESGNVSLGKLLHKQSYKREKKEIEVDGKIKIDFVKNDAVISEVKKSDKLEDSHIWQLKYYLYYLKTNKMVNNVTGKIHYPKLKKVMDVFLEEDDVEKLKGIFESIKKVLENELPEKIEEKRICKKCAYYEFCFI
jgi:CRISPR-associated exonuclease Cas4